MRWTHTRMLSGLVIAKNARPIQRLQRLEPGQKWSVYQSSFQPILTKARNLRNRTYVCKSHISSPRLSQYWLESGNRTGAYQSIGQSLKSQWILEPGKWRITCMSVYQCNVQSAQLSVNQNQSNVRHKLNVLQRIQKKKLFVPCATNKHITLLKKKLETWFNT